MILAGVHDIKNLKVKYPAASCGVLDPRGSRQMSASSHLARCFAGIKIRPEEKQSYNSPWNISADFCVDLSFSPEDIVTMLRQYENDHHTGMDISGMAESLYAYTEGYPFLVSCLCKHMDENALPWTQNGLQSSVKILLGKPNTLFDDIIKNLENHREFKDMVEGILLQGADVSFVVSNPDIAVF